MSEPSFEELYTRDVQKYVEKIDKSYTDKNGKYRKVILSYLSWAYGHREMKIIDPDSSERIIDFPMIVSGQVFENVRVPYLWTPRGYFVRHEVTINGRTEIETLPVLDHKNKPIEKPTTFQINTSNKRCFVKALAKHGLGLYLYVGEDLPEDIVQREPATDEQKAELKKLFEEAAVLNNVTPLGIETSVLTQFQYSGLFEDITKSDYEQFKKFTKMGIEKLKLKEKRINDE